MKLLLYVLKRIINDVSLNFGIIDEEGIVNGLLGLDVLIKLGIKINLDKLELKLDRQELL
ncbi:hypothetical protein EXN19_20020 [Clostridium butyricum]|nr:hypothetical protein [Clostridium butyricum]NFB92798.1 hypothetical protein [Clostridium butyricum]